MSEETYQKEIKQAKQEVFDDIFKINGVKSSFISIKEILKLIKKHEVD